MGKEKRIHWSNSEQLRMKVNIRVKPKVCRKKTKDKNVVVVVGGLDETGKTPWQVCIRHL